MNIKKYLLISALMLGTTGQALALPTIQKAEITDTGVAEFLVTNDLKLSLKSKAGKSTNGLFVSEGQQTHYFDLVNKGTTSVDIPGIMLRSATLNGQVIPASKTIDIVRQSGDPSVSADHLMVTVSAAEADWTQVESTDTKYLTFKHTKPLTQNQQSAGINILSAKGQAINAGVYPVQAHAVIITE